MVLATLTIAISMGMATIDEKPLVCPIMGSEVSKESPAVEYAGAKFSFCCAGCDTNFAKDPKKHIKENAKKGHTIGAYFFDPVSREQIKPKKAKGSVDYHGVRYYFSSEENKATFEKDKKKYGTIPAKESLTCAVMGSKVESYSKAPAYVDYKDVRYYMCCVGCVGMMNKEPAKYAGKAVTEPKVLAFKKS